LTLPNFLVIGVARGGTTSLDRYLSEHPQVFMARKEPNFFALEGVPLDFVGPATGINEVSVTRLAEYEALFDGVTDETAIGDASPLYLYWPGTAERIHRYVPRAKLIAILRNPADRAHSKYLHYLGYGQEPARDFADALRLEPERRAAHWSPYFSYVEMGRYAAQLRRYYELFDRAQIAVWLYDDLERDPASLMREVFRFLGVDESFRPDVRTRHNPAGVPKQSPARRLVSRVARAAPGLRALLPRFVERRAENWLSARAPIEAAMPPAVRRQLVETFRSDVEELQRLIGRDLSHWLA
jgi:hypothetical protein